MQKINVLHLTDIHFGQKAMSGTWPTVKASFFADLEYLVGSTGEIDVVAITGDIANWGLGDEYDTAFGFIMELAYKFMEIGQELPRLVVVPGNHDLVRVRERTLEQRALESNWDAEVQEEFVSKDSSQCRNFVEAAFENFAAWSESLSTVLPGPSDLHKGMLPGDFTGSYIKNNFSLGFIGLNSSFRHLSDWPREGSLSLLPEQFQAAAGGDLPTWSSRHDVSILMTHHPFSWLENADDARDAGFNEGSSVKLHLCGHLHLEKYEGSNPGTPFSTYMHQGQSLFGADFDLVGKSVARQHGYAVLQLQKEGQNIKLKVFPRSAVRIAGGVWNFERSVHFGLARGSESSQLIKLSSTQKSGAGDSNEAPSIEKASVSHVVTHEANENQVEKQTFERNVRDFLEVAAAGHMVAILGEMSSSLDGSQIIPLKDFRQALISELGLVVSDGGATADELYRLLKASNAKRAREIAAYYLGNVTEGLSSIVPRVMAGPWAATVQLSPAQAYSESSETDQIAKLGFVVSDISTAKYRLPSAYATHYFKINGTVDSSGNGSYLDGGHSSDRADWLSYTSQLLVRSPTIFLTDSVGLLDIWKRITDRDAGRSDYRLPSFLVTPELDDFAVQSLEIYGVKWIKSTVSEFAQNVLKTSDMQISDGLRRINNRRSRTSSRIDLSVASKRMSLVAPSREYLRGKEPDWADIVGGMAAELSATDRLISFIESTESSDVILVSSTAGSGRTTTLMQAALRLDSAGRRVGWIESRSSQRIPKISSLVDHVIEQDFEIVFVDDADGFGELAEKLLNDLRSHSLKARKVVASVRSVREEIVTSVPFIKQIAPRDLTERDVNLLVEKLRQHNAVSNRKLSDRDLRDKILDDSNGQLLVGLIQATSGLPFNQKIAEECGGLNRVELQMYGAICLVTAEAGVITLDQALAAVSGDVKEKWKAFNRLTQWRLILVQVGGVYYEARHRVVAETVREHLRSLGQLATVVGGTLHAFAAAAADLRDNSRPERRVLIRLLSHTYLRKLLLSAEEVRHIYQSIESVLDDDFHYWLQRGSFELEQGDQSLSLHALMTARTLAGGENDRKVLTTFSRLRLQIAARQASIETISLGLEAVRDLHRVIAVAGVNSPHTIVILANDAVPWLVSAPIGKETRRELMEKTRLQLIFAARLDASNPEVAGSRETALRVVEEAMAEDA